MSRFGSALGRVLSEMESEELSAVRRIVGTVPFLRWVALRTKSAIGNALLSEKIGWVQKDSRPTESCPPRLQLRDASNDWPGHLELAVRGLLHRFCTPGSVFYDIGAHLGVYSFEMARCVGPKGRVFAFEPDPENCVGFNQAMIRNNLQSRVELVETAVWSYTSSYGVPFKRGRSTAHGGVLADGVIPVLADGETRPVSTVSLDDFIREGNPIPNVLKIDVEGGECEVLKGAKELLSRCQPALLCEVHHELAARWTRDWLPTNGYAAEWLIPRKLYPRLVVAQSREAP